MDFKSEIYGDVAVVHVYLNRATLAKAIAFKDFTQNIIDEGYSKLIVDLSMSEYLDSTFLGAMVSLLKKVSVLNGDLRLVYKKEMPSLMLVLTRMDKVFKIFDDLQGAIESFNGSIPKLEWQ